MKKSKKLKALHKVCGVCEQCEFNFKYSQNASFYYVLDFNEKLCYCAVEDDFILNGFEINRLRDTDLVSVLDNATNEINRRNGILDGLEAPDVDISSWKAVFNSLAKADMFIRIENEYTDFFRIGKIKKVKKKSVVFKSFDGDGVWQPKIKIPFSEITTVRFGDRYSEHWKVYLTRRNK